MAVNHKTPGHGLDADRSVFSRDGSGSGERDVWPDGPLYAAIAHAPLGAMVIGVVSGVVSGVLVSLITIAATGQGWPGVIGAAVVCVVMLWFGWVFLWRNTERGHRWLNIGVAVVVAPIVITVVVLTIVQWATDTDTPASWLAFVAAVVAAGVWMVSVNIREIRRGLDADIVEQRRTNMRALAGIDPPDWVVDHTTRLNRIEDQLDHLATRRPMPVRTASVGEWWGLRPRWKGPTG